MRQNPKVNAAADAIGEGVVGAASAAEGLMTATCEELNEGSDLGRIVNDDAWAEEKRVGVEGNATGRCVVAAEVADYTQVGDGFVGEGTADTVLIEAAGAPQAEIGVTDRSVKGGLRA